MRTFSLLFCIAITLTSFAQSFEIGVSLSGSSYMGDLAPRVVNISTSKLHPAPGVFFRYNAHPFFSARLNFYRGKISADDSFAKDKYRRKRNLSFESNITEMSLIGEINLFGYDGMNLQTRYSPYIFAGVSVFRFNPKANIDGELVDLQPLGTEGQGMPGFGARYGLTQLAVPIGVGVKFAIDDRFAVGVEFGIRLTSTDYLDDVSTNYVAESELIATNGATAQALADRRAEILDNPESLPTVIESGVLQRGNPNKDDAYSIAGFTFSYYFSADRRYNRRRGNRYIRGGWFRF